MVKTLEFSLTSFDSLTHKKQSTPKTNTKSLGPPCSEIGIFTPDPLIASDCVIHLPVYCNHFLFACQAVNT